MAARKKDIPLNRIWRALQDADGKVGRAAAILGVSRGLVLRRIAEYRQLEQAKLDRELRAYDEAWKGIYKGIEEGNRRIIKWFLTRYGEERGYGLQRRPRTIPLMASQTDVIIEHFKARARLQVMIERETRRHVSQHAATCGPAVGPRPKRTARP